MKRIVLAIVMAVMCVGAQAQSYDACMKRLIALQSQKAQYAAVSGQVVLLFEQQLKPSGEWNDDVKTAVTYLAEEYMEQQFEQDMVGIMGNYYKNNIALGDLEKCLAILENPAVAPAWKKLSDSSGSNEMGQEVAQKLLAGQASSIKPLGDAEWQKAYNRYAKLSGLDAAYDSMYSMMEQVFAAQGTDSNNPQVKQFLQQFMKVFPEAMGNFYYRKGVSTADLNAVNAAIDIPEWEGMRKAASAMVADAMNMGQQIILNMVNYISEHAEE